MNDKHWEDMSIEDRIAVWKIYREILHEKEGWWINFEQCDACWTGSKWITIKYTFGVTNN